MFMNLKLWSSAMPCCFVPGCKSGYKSCGEVRRSFLAPRNKDVFSQWEKAIPRKDRKLSARSYVCDIHFSEDLIVKVDKFVINGEETELPRLRWRLKPVAVPHIFPNLPKHLTTRVKKRKSPRKRKSNSSNRSIPSPNAFLISSVTEYSQQSQVDSVHLNMEVESEDLQFGDVAVNDAVELSVVPEHGCVGETKTEIQIEDHKILEYCSKLHSYVGEMKSEVPIKPEPVWLLEDEAVLAGLKTESLSICPNIKKEYMVQDITSCKPAVEENTYYPAAVKNDTSESSKDCEESNRGVKSEIEIEDHTILFHSSEFLPSSKRSGDISGQDSGTNIVTTTDHHEEDEHLKGMSKSTGGENQLKCKTSSKNLSNFCDRSLDIQAHISEEQYKCDLCSKCFKCYEDITLHIRTHTGDKRFKCELCSKSFIRSDSLKNHMRNHTGDKPFKCKECGKCFMRSNSVKSHMLTHTGDKPFKCKICSKCFTKSCTLSQHLRTHTGDKPFNCEVCRKSFNRSGAVTRHMRTHTGDKPFKCKVCSKCFTESGNLAQHVRTHTGDKPFECKVCKKSFTESSTLVRHTRTHTGDKLFKCKICSKSFTRTGGVARHMRTHTELNALSVK